jgi:glycosyltransferase involved in cell wall biosynthesis
VVALTDALAGCEGVEVALLSQGILDAPTVAATVAQVERQVALAQSPVALALGLPLRRLLGHVGRAGAARVRSAAVGSTGVGSARAGLVHNVDPTRNGDLTHDFDLIHSHGVWHPANHWAARAARAWGVPLIVHPRGMLEPWALGQKAWKKRLALALFQRADLEGAAALVATSEMEYANLRQLGLRQPIAVIPNGVALPDSPAVAAPSPMMPVTPDSRRVALFLSRVHPKKGVLELVRAWGQAAPQGWRLRIAGPDEGGHWSEVARLVDQLGLGPVAEYVGPVEGARTAALYREADLFVLPTFSENFGLVVAEALTYGVPVITTRGAPWADLETYGCGWWIDTGVAPLVAALRQATALSDAERQAMGARGRDYVRRYDWDAIAAETLALYRWVLGQGGRPACVRTD